MPSRGNKVTRPNRTVNQDERKLKEGEGTEESEVVFVDEWAEWEELERGVFVDEKEER